MQGLAGKAAACGPGTRVGEIAPLAPRIEGITYDRVADIRHVDPYLVGATRDRAAADQGGAGHLLVHVIEGPCRPALRDHRHALALPGMTVDRSVHDPVGFPGKAVTYGQIGLVDLPVSKRDGETEVGPIRFRHHQQPGGVLVEPVDDPGTFDTPDAGKVLAVVEEGVDEGACGVAGRGMDNEAGGFIHQQDVIVLEYDVERNVLRLRVEDFERWFVDRDPIAAVDPRRWFGGLFVELNMTGVDQPADAGSGPVGMELGEAAVEAGSVELGGNPEGVMSRHFLACRPTHTWRPIPMTIKPNEMS